MHVQVHYQNLKNTPWMDEFVEKRVSKLDRYLAQSANVQVNLRYQNQGYVTSLVIHNPQHDYAFNVTGGNLYESLAEAVDKAARVLGEHKRRVKDKIHRRFFSLKKVPAPS